jgi:hypothetical protein
MIYLSITAFALAAIFGLTILIRWFGNTDAPRAVIYSHGILAATGLVLLLIVALKDSSHAPVISILLFTIAALAGFYMFFRDIVKKKRTLFLAFIHGIVAVTAFVILLVFVLGGAK